MKRLICIVTLLAPLAWGQVNNPSVIPGAPPATCTAGIPLWSVYSTGALYVCNNGVPTAVGGGGGGVTSLTGDGTIISNSGSTGAVTLTLANSPTGSGRVVLATSPTLVTPTLGTPASGVITNLTGTCTSCTANSAGSVTNALTLNNSNSGAASGTTYNGSSAVTASANTFGAGSLANANSWSAAQTITVAGAASTPNIFDTGSVFTGGSTTTTTPHWLIQPASVTGGAIWNTAGTGLGMNFASGFSGLGIDLHVNNGATFFKVDTSGNLTLSGSITGATNITSTGHTATLTAQGIFTEGATTFTVSGCGTAGSVTGTGTVGSFTVGTGATNCTFTVTLDGATGLTATHGWVAKADDTTANIQCANSTTVSTTTVVFTCTGTIATSDLIKFLAFPY